MHVKYLLWFYYFYDIVNFLQQRSKGKSGIVVFHSNVVCCLEMAIKFQWEMEKNYNEIQRGKCSAKRLHSEI